MSDEQEIAEAYEEFELSLLLSDLSDEEIDSIIGLEGDEP